MRPSLRFAVSGALAVATAAFAAPWARAQTAAATSASGPWEMEVHAGGAFTPRPSGGSSHLPPPGPTFTDINVRPSRQVPSWFFGDGASLFNEVAGALGIGRIAPLDPALTTAGRSRGTGGSFGVRVSRRLAGRFSAEFNVDYNSAPAKLTGAARDAIDASSDSFQSAWNSFFYPLRLNLNGQAFSTVRFEEHAHGQTFVSGAMVVGLGTVKSITPYLTGGGGAVFNSGGMDSATLYGNYLVRFPNNMVAFNEIDTVTVHYGASPRSAMVMVGAGIRGAISNRWGWRVDARVHVVQHGERATVSATPFTPVYSTGAYATGTAPGIQLSTLPGVPSSLSGSPLQDFETFSAGRQLAAFVSAGFYTSAPFDRAQRRHAAGSPSTPPSMEFGVKGGFVSSEVVLDKQPEGMPGIRFDRRSGGATGVYLVFAPGAIVAFQPEVLVTTKGAVERVENHTANVHLTYLELPLLARLRLTGGRGWHPFVVAGPSVGLRLHGLVIMDGEEQPIESDTRTLDAGLAIGGGVKLSAAQLELRYTHGVTTFLREGNNPDLRNRTLALLVGVQLW